MRTTRRILALAPSTSAALLATALLGACDGNTTPDAGGMLDAGPPCGEPFTQQIYETCQCTTDCAGESACFTEDLLGIPGGSCTPACTTDDECAGGRCLVVLDDGRGFCQQTCEDDNGCGAGRRCVLGVCVGWCNDDAECNSGHCNRYTHLCDGGPPREGKDTGERCLNDDECLSLSCDTVNLGGRCSTLCTHDPGSCPEGNACVFNGPTEVFGACFPSCEDAGGCGEGLDCVQVAYPASARVCLPASTAVDCAGRTSVMVDGAPCACPADCAYGYRCIEEWRSAAPHGVCVRACDTMGMRVSDDPSCGEGLLCHRWIDISVDDGDGACFPRCETNAECPHGRVCSHSEGCIPFCQGGADCYSGECDAYRGWCGEITFPSRAGIGAFCDGVSDCRSSICRENETTGFCTAGCDVERQGCPDDAVCVNVGDGPYGRCMPACADASACAAIPGAVCLPSGDGLRMHCDLPGAT